MMHSSAPTVVGQEKIKNTYDGIFNSVRLDLNYTIDEIIIDGDYGFVRLTSKGTASIKSTGETAPEENREMFVGQKVDGQWKIARYINRRNEYYYKWHIGY